MRALLDRIRGARASLSYSSVMVVYRSQEGTWRGFVMPYDVTYEGKSREEVAAALREMLSLYVDGLKEYDSPKHLMNIPLSDKEDAATWNRILQDLMSRLLNKERKINTPEYYAEAQLPA